MALTFQYIIDAFIDGETDIVSGTKSSPGNLKVIENQLIHYNTPIAERYNDKFIVNITRYSIQTGQVQKKIKESISEEKLIFVKRVPSDMKGSLKDYIED